MAELGLVFLEATVLLSPLLEKRALLSASEFLQLSPL